MYHFLDKFFIIFHTLIIIFNLFGWAWKKTRRLNLVVILLTAFSWFILGIWYGIGYCPCTHWHWLVRYKLGLYDMPNSYIKFLLDYITGLDFDAILVDYLTAIFFAVALIISSILNIIDFRKMQKSVT